VGRRKKKTRPANLSMRDAIEPSKSGHRQPFNLKEKEKAGGEIPRRQGGNARKKEKRKKNEKRERKSDLHGWGKERTLRGRSQFERKREETVRRCGSVQERGGEVACRLVTHLQLAGGKEALRGGREEKKGRWKGLTLGKNSETGAFISKTNGEKRERRLPKTKRGKKGKN